MPFVFSQSHACWWVVEHLYLIVGPLLVKVFEGDIGGVCPSKKDEHRGD